MHIYSEHKTSKMENYNIEKVKGRTLMNLDFKDIIYEKKTELRKLRSTDPKN